MRAHLTVLNGELAGQTIELSNKTFLIGRELDCHLRLPDELVSRHHCVFRMDEFNVRLRDLGSTNGTFVNGRPNRIEVGLEDSDKVRVGDTVLQLTIDPSAPAADEETEHSEKTKEIVVQDTSSDATRIMGDDERELLRDVNTDTKRSPQVGSPPTQAPADTADE